MLKPEYKDVHLLTLASTGPTDIWTSKKQVRTIEDLKGLKIRVAGTMPTMMIKALGATPVFMHIRDVYEALERGTVDGVFVGRSPMMAFRFHEVVKYGIEVSIFSQTYFYVMNLDRWKSLPPDLQKIMNEVSGMHHAELNGKGFDAEKAFVTQKIFPKSGVQVYAPPQAELERWKKAIMPIYDWWVKDLESKKLPAKKLLEEVQRLSKKYSGK
jgi:TRAP-type C4-dicarboxylate transport system substrate-binding protein